MEPIDITSLVQALMALNDTEEIFSVNNLTVEVKPDGDSFSIGCRGFQFTPEKSQQQPHDFYFPRQGVMNLTQFYVFCDVMHALALAYADIRTRKIRQKFAAQAYREKQNDSFWKTKNSRNAEALARD